MGRRRELSHFEIIEVTVAALVATHSLSCIVQRMLKKKWLRARRTGPSKRKMSNRGTDIECRHLDTRSLPKSTRVIQSHTFQGRVISLT
jgi:hypothetical protein